LINDGQNRLGYRRHGCELTVGIRINSKASQQFLRTLTVVTICRHDSHCHRGGLSSRLGSAPCRDRPAGSPYEAMTDHVRPASTAAPAIS
jgi:hypothetical protein